MTKLGSVGSVGYQKPGLWEVNANLIEHLIQIRFLWFFIPILPDLILPNQIQSTNRKKFFSLLIDEC